MQTIRTRWVEILEDAAIAILCITAVFLLAGCTPFVTELADSSGCMFTTGGPYGVTFGSITVCRSGKDKAVVYYKDGEREIKIEHLP